MSHEEYRFANYPNYIATKHWQNLREDIIFKRGSHCYICGRVSTLLLHHISYENLFKEKLYRDVFILCFKCHNQVHFWTILKLKVPLTTNWLFLSMHARKLLYYTQNAQFGLMLIWFLFVVILGISYLYLAFFRKLISFISFILGLAFSGWVHVSFNYRSF